MSRRVRSAPVSDQAAGETEATADLMQAAGTMSWTDPENDLNVVIMVQQPTKEFPEDIARVVFNAIN